MVCGLGGYPLGSRGLQLRRCTVCFRLTVQHLPGVGPESAHVQSLMREYMKKQNSVTVYTALLA